MKDLIIQQDVSLAKYNTFGVDVEISYLAEIQKIEELRSIYRHPEYAKKTKLILGDGSNVLFLHDMDVVVLCMRNQRIELEKDTSEEIYLKVDAGTPWSDLLKYCLEKSLWGLENLIGIPGRVGSAPVQNIGAYGVELKDVMESLEAYDTEEDTMLCLKNSDCEFSYRSSIFKKKAKGRYVIWSVTFKLSKKPKAVLNYGNLAEAFEEFDKELLKPQDIAKQIEILRKQKLPDYKKLACAGSFFKNPIVHENEYTTLKNSYPDMVSFVQGGEYKISAAWLIQNCGWLGYREGDVGVYDKQALVLVNYGLASGREIFDLAQRIRNSVEKKFGLRLETEVEIIGSEQGYDVDKKYAEVLETMFACLPMFQKIGATAYKSGLKNILNIMEALQNPHRRFKSIHVAGTNGKGSSSHLLASVFQAAGYKTALYTSPHLKDFRERIKINGELISKEEVIDFYLEYETLFQKTKASFFEMTVAMAFDYFAKQRVDIAIIEVGMGGRLDSTNIITPELSLITNISFDHTQFLGSYLSKIAEEKAGIIKDNVPVVVSETQLAVSVVFQRIAKAKNAKLTFADSMYILCECVDADYFRFNVYKNGSLYLKAMECGLLGSSYQAKNILGVLCALDILQEKYSIGEDAVRQGFKQVVERTSLYGRWQKLSEQPLVVCDTGHNEAGFELVLRQIRLTPHTKLHMVMGLVSDKDCSKMLKMLPSYADYYFCAANIPRALSAESLQQEAAAFGLRGEAYPSVRKALAAAKLHAEEDDLIFVGGSTFVVAEVC